MIHTLYLVGLHFICYFQVFTATDRVHGTCNMQILVNFRTLRQKSDSYLRSVFMQEERDRPAVPPL